MPDGKLVTAESRQSDQDNFDAVFDSIVDKTDKELEGFGKEGSTEKTDEQSEGTTKDQSDATTTTSTKDPSDSTNESGQDQVGLATNSDADDWKAKASELETELKKERQKTSSWDGRIRSANNKVKELEAEIEDLQSKLDAVNNSASMELEQSDQEVLDKFKETFPELVDVVNVMQRKIDKASSTKSKTDKGSKTFSTTEQHPDPDDQNATSDDTVEQDSQEALVDMLEVRRVHADVDEAVSSGKILTWINTQADYIKPTLENIYYGANGYGSTKQVLDLLNNFKKETGWSSSLLRDKEKKSSKLNSMVENEGTSGGPVDKATVDINDFDAAAKAAGL